MDGILDIWMPIGIKLIVYEKPNVINGEEKSFPMLFQSVKVGITLFILIVAKIPISARSKHLKRT